MTKYILFIPLFLIACAPDKLSDKRVQRKEVGSKTECRYIYNNGGGGCVDMEVPAYYLISSDNMVCEVDSKEYVTTRIEYLHLCVWKDSVP